MQKEPDQPLQKNRMLAYGARYHPLWLDMCDSDVCLKVYELEDVRAAVFVGFGGGHGVGVGEVRGRYSGSPLPAKVILQESPEIIEEVKPGCGKQGSGRAMEKAELQRYDFFVSQLVRGATIHFLASVMHDWPDKDAKKIFDNIAAEMVKRQSKLLVSDYIVPAQCWIPQVSGLDPVKMSVLGSMERTKATWHELLASQRLKLVKTHITPTAYK